MLCVKKNKNGICRTATVVSKAFGMVEVIIASAIIAVVLVAVITVYQNMARISLDNTENIQAAFLLEEGAEIVRIWRDNNWSNITSNTVGATYRPYWDGTNWIATTSPYLIDASDRTVVFSNVYRDGSFNIVNSGGTLDSNSRKATITVSWSSFGNATNTKSLEMYIFNTFSD